MLAGFNVFCHFAHPWSRGISNPKQQWEAKVALGAVFEVTEEEQRHAFILSNVVQIKKRYSAVRLR